MRAFRIPLAVPLRGIRARQGVLLRGRRGWGEWSPWPGALPAEAGACWAAAREAAFEAWPEPRREAIAVHATIPDVSPELAAELVRASGCRVAKVKAGDEDDEPRVEAAAAALGPGGRIRIDANGAWDVAAAERKIRALAARCDLELVEQPVRTLEEMATLRRRVDVPLAADESVRTIADARRAAALAAADALVLKVQPMGGVRAALRVAEAARLPVIVSSPLETSVGIAAGLAFAAALPELPYACGLATLLLLTGDVTADPLLPVEGVLAVRRPAASEEALAGFEIPASEITLGSPR